MAVAIISRVDMGTATHHSQTAMMWRQTDGNAIIPNWEPVRRLKPSPGPTSDACHSQWPLCGLPFSFTQVQERRACNAVKEQSKKPHTHSQSHTDTHTHTQPLTRPTILCHREKRVRHGLKRRPKVGLRRFQISIWPRQNHGRPLRLHN